MKLQRKINRLRPRKVDFLSQFNKCPSFPTHAAGVENWLVGYLLGWLVEAEKQILIVWLVGWLGQKSKHWLLGWLVGAEKQTLVAWLLR